MTITNALQKIFLTPLAPSPLGCSSNSSKPTPPPPPTPTPDAAVVMPDAATVPDTIIKRDSSIIIIGIPDSSVDALLRQDILGDVPPAPDSVINPDSAGIESGTLDAFPGLDTVISHDLPVAEAMPLDAGAVCEAILPPTTNPLINDDLNSLNSSLWSASNWANGGVFNVGWRPDHISFSGGFMTIQLDNAGCPSGCYNMPYASGEYRSNANYGFGLLEGQFKPAKAAGTDSSLFLYTGPSDNGNPWDETDIEILGKDTTKMQTNYIVSGVGGHEVMIDLGFDAAQDWHDYAVNWTKNAICWYVDKNLVRQVIGSAGTPLPVTAGKIMMNLWTGTSAETAWLGALTYTGQVTAQYRLVRFTPAN